MFFVKSKQDLQEVVGEIKNSITHRLHEHGAQLVCLGVSPEKRKIFIQSYWEGDERREKAKAFNKLPEVKKARKLIEKRCKKIKDYRYDQILE